MLKTMIFNTVTFGPLFVVISNALGLINVSYDFDNLPSIGRHLLQLFVCYVFGDFWFYWMHRLAHTKKFYWIHKVHHESKNTVALASLNVHWLEFVFVDLIVLMGGPMLLGSSCHFSTALAWI